MKFNASKNYLKVDDVKDGDLVTIKDAGSKQESTKFFYDDGNPKVIYVFIVEYEGKEYSLNFGKFTIENLCKAYGDDSDLWIGKNAKITIENYRALGKKGIILEGCEEKTDHQKLEEEWDKA